VDGGDFKNNNISEHITRTAVNESIGCVSAAVYTNCILRFRFTARTDVSEIGTESAGFPLSTFFFSFHLFAFPTFPMCTSIR